MAHFAELNPSNIVKQVIVIDNRVLEDENGVEVEQLGINYCKSLYGENTKWVQTSYNDRIRKRYAGIGCIYDEERDAFIFPQPYPSWSLNEETLDWDPPSPKPEPEEGQMGFYEWDEESTSWVFVEFTPPIEDTEEVTEEE
jgi:hypothetical protein